MGPTSGQVVARLLSLSRIARNSAVLSICVLVVAIYVIYLITTVGSDDVITLGLVLALFTQWRPLER